ncbi:MAG: hypothetical protein EON87_00190 [Brevundimonas sp.]|nr:MAG: hypothetical protein EON87_00190 [Brevundimonas sp.]
MVTIDEHWWLHLAPKAMHPLRLELERLLRAWVRTAYGAHWLNSAARGNGLIRVKPGQVIPAFHAIKLDGRPMFVAPPSLLKPGHRGVGQAEMASRRPLEAREIALQPEIRLDLVDDPVLLEAARRGEHPLRPQGVTRPSQVFTLPAHYLIAPSVRPDAAYVLYQHIFGEGGSYPNDGWFYVGLTTRSWQTRWAEHQRAMRSGSALRFHRTFRDEQTAGRITYVNHKVMGITDDLEALYQAEAFLVEGHWEDQRRLNMIPGGKDGLRYLRDHGIIPPGPAPEPDAREPVLAEWLAARSAAPLPRTWLKDRWGDRTWAAAQICSRKDRLSIEQVAAIRALAEDHTAAEIADRIGAAGPEQVQGVIDGKTYHRVGSIEPKTAQ